MAQAASACQGAQAQPAQDQAAQAKAAQDQVEPAQPANCNQVAPMAERAGFPVFHAWAYLI